MLQNIFLESWWLLEARERISRVKAVADAGRCTGWIPHKPEALCQGEGIGP